MTDVITSAKGIYVFISLFGFSVCQLAGLF